MRCLCTARADAGRVHGKLDGDHFLQPTKNAEAPRPALYNVTKWRLVTFSGPDSRKRVYFELAKRETGRDPLTVQGQSDDGAAFQLDGAA